MRERDRLGNKYPKLHYPELYVLKGGYKDFFSKCRVRANSPWLASICVWDLCHVLPLSGTTEWDNTTPGIGVTGNSMPRGGAKVPPCVEAELSWGSMGLLRT